MLATAFKFIMLIAYTESREFLFQPKLKTVIRYLK